LRAFPLGHGGTDPAAGPGPAGQADAGSLPEALLEVATALNRGLGRQEVLARIAIQLRRLVPFTGLTIGRADSVARVVTPVFNQGPWTEETMALRIPYGTGLTGRAAETGEPVIFNQADGDDPTLEPGVIPGTPPPQPDEYLLVLPLVGSDGVEGTLALYREGRGQQPWRQDEVHVARLFATQAQVAFHNAELYAAAEERARRLATMNGILRATSGSLDLDAICRAWQAALRDLLPFTGAVVALAQAPGVLVPIWASEGLDLPAGQPLPPGAGPAWAVEHGGYVVGDVRADLGHGAHHGFERSGMAAVVAAPLVARGRAFGAIGLGHPQPGRYDERSLGLLDEVARQVAAALDNALLHQEVVARKANQSALLAKLISAQEEERKAIADDLHDDTIQVLAAALMQVDRVTMARPEVQPELLGRLRDTLQTTMASARKLMFDLRPPVLDAEGLVPALHQQLELLRAEDGIEVELHHDLDRRLDPMVETVVFRSLQEALHNVRRHARAGRVRVEVRAPASGRVTAVLADDGVGFDVEAVLPQALAGGHLGLHSLLERIDLVGGSVDLDSRPGAGTRLTLRVPASLGAGGR
jgi:signal transduction histidine kinase